MSENINEDIMVIEADDWMVVYKEGEKVYEGHRASPLQLLRSLNIGASGIFMDDEDDTGQLEKNGGFPNSLDEFKQQYEITFSQVEVL